MPAISSIVYFEKFEILGIMKTIKIRKNREFSARSKIFVKIGDQKVHVKGFGSVSLPIRPGEELCASHIWTGSNRLNYDHLKDGSSILIRPRLGRVYIISFFLVFSVCYAAFNITRQIWYILPISILIIYGINYLTVMSNRYLILEVKDDG
jgi:hypothetical protein